MAVLFTTVFFLLFNNDGVPYNSRKIYGPLNELLSIMYRFLTKLMWRKRKKLFLSRSRKTIWLIWRIVLMNQKKMLVVHSVRYDGNEISI